MRSLSSALSIAEFLALLSVIRRALSNRKARQFFHPSPRKRGRGTTLRSSVVEGAPDSTLHFRRRSFVESGGVPPPGTARAPPAPPRPRPPPRAPPRHA